MTLRLLAPAALIAAIGCYGPTPGGGSFHYDGSFSQGDGTHADGGDGGDAGDAGDGGSNDGGKDAGGCTIPQDYNPGVLDNCTSTNGTPAFGYVHVESNCTATISWQPPGTTCSGPVSGVTDSFDGGCGAYASCTAPSIPGTITCQTATVPCTIKVCNSTDGTCPP
jgi:hypothetical protein